MPSAIRLPFSFDAALLQRDLAAAEAFIPWERHFNTLEYFGEWRGIALLGVGGNPHFTLMNYPDRVEVSEYPVLASCPYMREVLAAFDAPVRAARLLSLEPGAGIREHRDLYMSHEYDEVRLHVPVVTNELVEFYANGEPLTMLAGECWYINVDQVHSAVNRGATPRVHLVVDLTMNEWVGALLGESVMSSRA